MKTKKLVFSKELKNKSIFIDDVFNAAMTALFIAMVIHSIIIWIL